MIVLLEAQWWHYGSFFVFVFCLLQQYNKAKMVQSETDDDIRPWIKGFVQAHGEQETSRLLQDVGKVGS